MGTSTIVDRHVEVGHEPPDDGELLRVLLAEIRAMRLHHLKQLQHDRRDAAEVAGPEFSTQMVGEPADVDAHSGGCGIHLGRRRRKHDVDAELAAERQVGLERARIARQIVLVVELQRVDEDRSRPPRRSRVAPA